jgi:hypothetical protein
MGLTIWQTFLIIGLILAGSKLDKSITVWMKDNPIIEKISGPVATIFVILGLFGILMEL